MGYGQTVVEEEVKPGVKAIKPYQPRGSLVAATLIVIGFYVVFGIYGYFNYVG